MIKRLLLTTLALVTSVYLNAQTDSLELIYVKALKDTGRKVNASEEPCYYKKIFVHRLDLTHPQNRFLATQYDRHGTKMGLLPIIVEQMMAGRVSGKDARDNSSSYRYSSLLEDMYMLEGLVQDYLPDTLNPKKIEWETLGHYVDFIAAECFDRDYSSMKRVVYSIRINYCDPNNSQKIFGVAIFPFTKLAPLLASLNLGNGWNALDMIHAQKYHSKVFRPEKDQFLTQDKPDLP